jgi:predicted negative regulator of RcsB-dependent stress response
MSFLEKEDGEKSSSFWDWVVGIGLVVLIGGFTVFYQYQKRSSTSRFQEADALYKSGKYKEAGNLYEELKSAQYLTTKDDSTIYARLDSIETAQEQQNAVVMEAKKKAAAGDAAGTAGELEKLSQKDLLSPEDQAWVDSVRSNSKSAPAADSSSAAAAPTRSAAKP